MNLPLHWKHSSIITSRGEFHSYYIGQTKQPIEIILQKCVECHLQIGIGTHYESLTMETVEDRVFRKVVDAKDGLYIKTATNNYAFYSITA